MEKTEFCVATNWDPALLENLQNLPVYEFIGTEARTVVGGGRPAAILPAPEPEEVAAHIAAMHKQGIQFNYLLNASCMGNMEYDKDTHRKLLRHLEWLSAVGVDAVTVSIPYLLELIKTQFPHFKVKISVIAGVNSLQKARFFEDLGADEINIDFMCNRDFAFLQAVRKTVSCSLTLLLNEICLFQCPFRLYHYNLSSHESQNWKAPQSFPLDYCRLSCTLQQLQFPEQIIKARWIRPEDLGVYRELGYERFKISGRSYSTSWLCRAVRAYTEGYYPGNLLEIFSGFLTLNEGQGDWAYLANERLDGFLDHFKQQDCTNQCAQCQYCAGLARRAVSYSEPQKAKFVAFLKELKRNYLESRFFR